jgi:hypothetical protein
LDFAAKIESAKKDLVSLLRDLKAEGYTIAGYGASVGCTTLVYHFELSDLLSYLIDDDPAKSGLFIPGYHIPVLASQAIYERNPNYVLVLAWRYAEVIMKKHQVYRDQGGHFIVPLPTIQVI